MDKNPSNNSPPTSTTTLFHSAKWLADSHHDFFQQEKHKIPPATKIPPGLKVVLPRSCGIFWVNIAWTTRSGFCPVTETPRLDEWVTRFFRCFSRFEPSKSTPGFMATIGEYVEDRGCSCEDYEIDTLLVGKLWVDECWWFFCWIFF